MNKNNPGKVKTTPPEAWVERYSDYLHSYAMSRLHDPEASADCVQDTFMVAIKTLHRFDGSRDIKYWLRGILRNKIVDQIRKSIKEQKVDIDSEDEASLENAYHNMSCSLTAHNAPWQFNPRKQYDNMEFWEVFGECIQQLKTNAREAFLLKFLEGQTTEEMCHTMNISPNHLSVLVHRARTELKSAFETKWTGKDPR
jgi:RNA polymerase sigma-70 factor (ECF subfamily)